MNIRIIKNYSFFSLSEKLRLMLHTINTCSGPLWGAQRGKWTSLRSQGGHWDIKKYWDITEEVTDAMGNMEKDWAMARHIMVIWDAQTEGLL
jgi:hypothetical protein